ncbi:MAG: tRNA uridine-5-carboxymethylaminomethyl(34) synthesis GTPase MnmE [Clostridia bacterium]|nr:tRNA uridine-5-carboxymethylaminomethyl(34) synthesis GTPase MnmE [Clostridia bacterium]MBQ5773111.1 tRNA uridine-5-carboxymethylaminomethyl(34) synthesis GTPase MnmE [Clostridia bacterium]
MIGDTIAAVSTPYGKGGVALLRVSGPEAVALCETVFLPAGGERLAALEARRATYGRILAPDERGEWHSVDDGIVTVFRAPASFTGEDTVEICCHGGILLTETVLSALFCAGARPAEAGEFTRRAFLNGKLGLSSAEALGSLLEARTREQLSLAHAGMHGKVEAASQEIYASIRRILASIYAGIDYPDEDLGEMSREEMEEAFLHCQERIEALVRTYRTGHAIAEGIPTVICGRPNVGKSSLYNRILGREAAIVTDVEGTTRDILTETVPMGRVTLRLSDTAGLHDTENAVEQIGIERARTVLANAELVLAVFDGARSVTEEDLALVRELEGLSATVIAVLNKADRGECTDPFYGAHFAHTVSVSAKTGEGMDALAAKVEALFTDGDLDVGRDAVLANARQYSSALSALEAIRRAISAMREGLPVELCCTDAELAMSALSELDGRAISEDIVSEIFSHFCVGK